MTTPTDYDHKTWVAAIPTTRGELINELMWQWEYNHHEHCGWWPHEKGKTGCHWPPPVLDALEGDDAPIIEIGFDYPRLSWMDSSWGWYKITIGKGIEETVEIREMMLPRVLRQGVYRLFHVKDGLP